MPKPERMRRLLTDEERNELAARWVPLAAKAALAAARAHGLLRREDVEDLVQEAVLGMLDAAEGFDPARGCQFQTYAGRPAKWRADHAAEILARNGLAGGSSRRVPRVGPFDLGCAEVGGVSPEQSVPARGPCPHLYWSAEEWRAFLAPLPLREAYVVLATYRDGVGARELSREMRISRARVGQLLRRALRKLRAAHERSYAVRREAA